MATGHQLKCKGEAAPEDQEHHVGPVWCILMFNMLSAKALLSSFSFQAPVTDVVLNTLRSPERLDN